MTKPITPNRLFELAGNPDGRGGKAAVARWTGLTRTAIGYWSKSGFDRIPAEHCKKIEVGSGGRITRRLLRPDLWDDPQAGEQYYHNEPEKASL